MARRFPLRAPRPLQWGRRLVDLLGPTGDAARQSLVALFLNSCTSFVAGAVLGAIVGTFEELPGLLLMVPAAIGLRGNIFGTFGNRVSTSVHAGTFSPSARRDSVSTDAYWGVVMTPGAAPCRPARDEGGPVTSGVPLCSRISDRGAIRLAISASPNSRSSPKSFR